MAIAAINASAAGDTAVVAAVTTPGNKKIRVKRLVLSALAANNVKLRSGTTDITGLIYMPATSTVPVVANGDRDWLFETAAGQALNVNLSAATAVGGWVEYTLE